MSLAPSSRIIFFSVKEIHAKIEALLQTVDTHATQKEKIVLLAPDLKSIQFLDDLLWSHPKNSFRPHTTTLHHPHHSIFLVQPPLSAPFPSIIFNLCPTPVEIRPPIKMIYELEDYTLKEGPVVFQKKFSFYQKMGCLITTGSLKTKIERNR